MGVERTFQIPSVRPALTSSRRLGMRIKPFTSRCYGKGRAHRGKTVDSGSSQENMQNAFSSGVPFRRRFYLRQHTTRPLYPRHPTLHQLFKHCPGSHILRRARHPLFKAGIPLPNPPQLTCSDAGYWPGWARVVHLHCFCRLPLYVDSFTDPHQTSNHPIQAGLDRQTSVGRFAGGIQPHMPSRWVLPGPC